MCVVDAVINKGGKKIIVAITVLTNKYSIPASSLYRLVSIYSIIFFHYDIQYLVLL